MELEWNIFPGFTTLPLCNKVQEFLSKMSTEPEDFTGRIIFMSMCNDILWRSEDNERECNADADPDGTAKFFWKRLRIREPTLRRNKP